MRNNNFCISKAKAAYQWLQSWYRRSHYCAICGWKFYPFDLCVTNTRTGNRMHLACYTNHRHWIDDADSYICPECGFTTDNPNKYYKCICPRCGFQDKKDV